MRYTAFTRFSLGAAACFAAVHVCAQALPATNPDQVGMSAQRLARLSAVLKEEIDQGRLPGAVVMVARKGKLVFSDAIGFQDKTAGTPMSRDAIFRIYSMTKPLVSVALMQLVEEGRVQLTDPVSKFLPAWKGQQVSVAIADAAAARVTYTLVPAAREATIQDLLRHTAGLAYGEITQNAPVKEAYAKAGVYKTNIDFEARDLTPAEEVERLGKAPLAHQPGTAWEYSLAVDVQGRVVEAVTGRRLADYMDERIFKPLKMTDSGFWVPKEKMSRVAQPLAIEPAVNRAVPVIDVSAPPKNDSGGAGGVSTAGDYLRFCQAMLNGGQLDGVRILARPTVQLMASDHLGPTISTASYAPGPLLLGVPGYTFGLGFMVRQGPGIAGVMGSQGEFMWAGYAGTYFWADPKEEICAVFMTQAPSPIRAYYRRLFKNLVYQSIAD
jgi:CubicO group peptidase (beta-lactamase class C family)